ncbi:MAG: TonB-dependent receptor, partial [Ginsengibacter sp.]
MKSISFPLKAIALICVTFFFFAKSEAQNGIIKGTVTDENGPLAGASVSIGGKNGTTTNNYGNYELSVKPGKHTLSITYVGYQLSSRQVDVKADQTVVADARLVNASLGENIVVLGSRSATGRSNLSTPVPVDVIPLAQVINEIGQVDLNQILNFIAPSFQSSRQTVSDGTDHIDPAQLRGLGTDQVLVLINGKRRHQSALVNVNGT